MSFEEEDTCDMTFENLCLGCHAKGEGQILFFIFYFYFLFICFYFLSLPGVSCERRRTDCHTPVLSLVCLVSLVLSMEARGGPKNK
jgi:hypothetical protein